MKMTLKQLSEQTEVPRRTIRFYIAEGLLKRPHGEKRGAWYDESHLEQLLRIRKWREAGLSLEAISELLHGDRARPIPGPRAGSVEVRSHLVIADGVELSVCADRAGMDTENVRTLFRMIREEYSKVAADIDSAVTKTKRTTK